MGKINYKSVLHSLKPRRMVHYDFIQKHGVRNEELFHAEHQPFGDFKDFRNFPRQRGYTDAGIQLQRSISIR
jgi:hypothetical protein